MKKLLTTAIVTASAITVLATSAFAVSANATYKLGDVNNDGQISIQDVTVLQSYLAGISQLSDTQLLAAEVTGDGYVDVADASTIQKYIAEIIDEFPAEKTKPTTEQPTQATKGTESDGYINVIVKP